MPLDLYTSGAECIGALPLLVLVFACLMRRRPGVPFL